MDWNNIPHAKRHEFFDKDYCWQYQMRLSNLDNQLEKAGLSKKEASKLRVSDFEFFPVMHPIDYPAPVLEPKWSKDKKVWKEYSASLSTYKLKLSSYEDEKKKFEKDNPIIIIDYKKKCLEIKEFIEENEWLQRMPNRPTHRFIVRLKSTGQLAGVVAISIPNSFSHVLGKEYKYSDRLISRGACISWAPKNLGSALIMYSVKWMAKNQNWKYFTAYSDPDANELGTIYQACNFYYMGQSIKKDGTPILVKQYYDDGYFDGKKKGWFSDREFRKKSWWMKYAKRIEPEFYKKIGMPDYKEKMFGFLSWAKAKKVDPPLALKWKPNWDLMEKKYTGLKERLEQERDKYIASCRVRETLPKHKYIYILGKDKRETKYLKKLFFENNPKLKGKEFNYPTERGK